MDNKAKRSTPKSMQALCVASFFFVATGCENRKVNKSASAHTDSELATASDALMTTSDPPNASPETTSIPAEIRDFLLRSKDCHHWAGEDGYDAERRAEIEKAMAELNCSALDSEKINLSKQFHKSPQLIDLIGSADTLSW